MPSQSPPPEARARLPSLPAVGAPSDHAPRPRASLAVWSGQGLRAQHERQRSGSAHSSFWLGEAEGERLPVVAHRILPTVVTTACSCLAGKNQGGLWYKLQPIRDTVRLISEPTIKSSAGPFKRTDSFLSQASIYSCKHQYSCIALRRKERF